MGQTISLAAMYCCCSASSSLCNACFGSVAVGTTGRKRSVLLFGIVIATSLWFQYYVGPSIVNKSGWIWKFFNFVPGIKSLINNAWYTDSCDKYRYDDSEESSKLVEQCAGNSGVFRPTFLATFYFLINAVATSYVPTLNREAWPAKYALFGFGLLISIFVPNSPLYTSFFLWFARIGASLFVVLQQIILIDVAYNWNDDWVERANESDRLSYGSGSNWLHAIVGVCVGLYTTSLVSVGYMYSQYTGNNNNNDDGEDGGGGCAGNTWVITLTLLGVIAITVIQLNGTEGSLLTSGVISLYAMYLCFSIVSKNPKGECNPQLGKNDVWGIAIGLLLTTVSLIWTGWSWSAETRLTTDSVQSAKAVNPIDVDNGADASSSLNLDVPLVDGEEAVTTGVVSSTGGGSSESSSLNHVWKLNVVLALISCYVAMILTGWGTVNGMDESNHNAANPTIGHVNMAILGVAQWLALTLYGWTLIAPQLFPDRDFT